MGRLTRVTILILALGAAGVLAQAPQPTPLPLLRAKAGDTVEKLAKRHGLDPNVLARHNGLLPTSVVGAGRELRFPSPVSQPVIRAEMGDTVTTLARRYEIEAGTLAKLNGLKPNAKLLGGQELKVPASAELPAACTYVMDVGSDRGAYRLYFQWPTAVRRSGSVEIWTCVEPISPKGYRREFKLPAAFDYGLQFMTIDCERLRVSMDPIVGYSSSNKLTGRVPASWLPSSPIVPGSIGEVLKGRLCR